jgi:hypothetical protein
VSPHTFAVNVKTRIRCSTQSKVFIVKFILVPRGMQFQQHHKNSALYIFLMNGGIAATSLYLCRSAESYSNQGLISMTD